MHAAVWVREIWDTRDLVGEILDGSGRPKWNEWEGRFDPEDLNALEMALQLKDADSAWKVTGLSVGPVRKLDVLRECLYRGVDYAVRISHEGQASLHQEALWMAKAVNQLEDVRVVLTGIQINEGDYAQKGALLARRLGWPLVSYVEAIEAQEGDKLRLRRAVEGGIQVVEAPLPAVISVGVALLKEDPRAPRSAKAKLKLKHKKTPIPEWHARDLVAGENQVGLPPVEILGYRPLEQREFPSQRINGVEVSELKRMLSELREKGLVR